MTRDFTRTDVASTDWRIAGDRRWPSGDDRQVLSVLVPAYNEAATIRTVLQRVLALGPVLKEIIVVDDGSTDGTADAARRVAEQYPIIRVHQFERNQGKTAAIEYAIGQATGEVVIVQDADLEYDPAEIPEVVRPILRGDADVVYGSRFLVRRAARVLYFYHYLANKALTLLSNLLTNRNMSDIETCYKCFRAGVIKPLRLTSRGFGMEVEITALVAKTNARTYEVPISYYGRTYEEGKKIGLRDGLAAIGYILYYNLIAPRRQPGRDYIRTVNANLAAAGSIAARESHAATQATPVPPMSEAMPQTISILPVAMPKIPMPTIATPIGDWPMANMSDSVSDVQ
jgi:glycosyltransferase involved in cell wall biosynthesis